MTEEWRDIPGFEGAYQVSSLGRVRGLDRDIVSRNGVVRHWRGNVLRPKWDGRYESVSLGERCTRRIHALVLLAFVGPPSEGQEARHIDGDSTNNRLENLAWGTHTENIADQRRHGTAVRGERQGSSRLTADQVREIRRRRADGEPQASVAAAFGVHKMTVTKITMRRAWKHVGDTERAA